MHIKKQNKTKKLMGNIPAIQSIRKTAPNSIEKHHTIPIAKGSVQLGCIQYFPHIPIIILLNN
jgi:hypothetical protein